MLFQYFNRVTLRTQLQFRMPICSRYLCTKVNALPTELVHRSGVLNFILPLPNKEKCVFPLYPHETVNDLIIDIREEDRESSFVELVDANGVRISHSTLVSDLIKTPFVISINENENYSVSASKTTEHVVENALGTPEIQDLIIKAFFQKVKKRMLEDEHRHHITYNEYLKICNAYGLTPNQASEYIRALHLVGDVLHFSNNEDLSHYIFLKPENITSALTGSLGLKLHTRAVPQLQQQLSLLLPSYLPLNSRKKELDLIAKNKTKWFMHGVLTYLLVQSGILAHMVWVDFSWGIMEPVTYFVFLTTLMGGYVFFILAREDYTYDGLKQRQVNKALKKLYLDKRNPFNWKKWNELHQQVQSLKGMLGENNWPKELKNDV